MGGHAFHLDAFLNTGATQDFVASNYGGGEDGKVPFFGEVKAELFFDALQGVEGECLDIHVDKGESGDGPAWDLGDQIHFEGGGGGVGEHHGALVGHSPDELFDILLVLLVLVFRVILESVIGVKESLHYHYVGVHLFSLLLDDFFGEDHERGFGADYQIVFFFLGFKRCLFEIKISKGDKSYQVNDL